MLCPFCMVRDELEQTMIRRPVLPGAVGQQVQAWSDGGWACPACGLMAPDRVFEELEVIFRTILEQTPAPKPRMAEPPPREKGCNRHEDCDAAEAIQREAGREPASNFHCLRQGGRMDPVQKASPKYPGYTRLKTAQELTDGDHVNGWIVLDVVPGTRDYRSSFVLGIDDDGEIRRLQANVKDLSEKLNKVGSDLIADRRALDSHSADRKRILDLLAVEQAKVKKLEIENQQVLQLTYELQKIRDTLGAERIQEILGCGADKH